MTLPISRSPVVCNFQRLGHTHRRNLLRASNSSLQMTLEANCNLLTYIDLQNDFFFKGKFIIFQLCKIDSGMLSSDWLFWAPVAWSDCHPGPLCLTGGVSSQGESGGVCGNKQAPCLSALGHSPEARRRLHGHLGRLRLLPVLSNRAAGVGNLPASGRECGKWQQVMPLKFLLSLKCVSPTSILPASTGRPSQGWERRAHPCPDAG